MKTPSNVDVAVAGGGIAGLTAALAFAGRGFSVLVLERAPAMEVAGAGLQLSPNATRILADLGALDGLRSFAVQPEAITLRNARSLRTIASVPLGEAATRRWGAPYLVAHRADLQAALVHQLNTCQKTTLLTDARATDIEFGDHGATLAFECAGERRRVACRLVVGADGVWSTVRGTIRPSSTSHFTGYIAWRAMLERGDSQQAATLFDATSVTAFLSPRFHLVAYPVSGGKAVNLVAVTKGRAIAQDWSVSAASDALDTATRKAAPALEAAIRVAGPWKAWPIHTVDAQPAWTHRRGLALIGDAAHAMTPFSAQGAAMAIEDAAVLATTVSDTTDMGTALASYEAARRQRVQRVAARGAFNRFVWHAGGPIALGRNMVLKLRPPARLMRDFDWLYGWNGGLESLDPEKL